MEESSINSLLNNILFCFPQTKEKKVTWVLNDLLMSKWLEYYSFLGELSLLSWTGAVNKDSKFSGNLLTVKHNDKMWPCLQEVVVSVIFVSVYQAVHLLVKSLFLYICNINILIALYNFHELIDEHFIICNGYWCTFN